jgi:RNA polymerase sigma-70 factor (ECF subfamily)
MPFDRLMDDLRNGSPTAANEVFHRFATRLRGLAGARLNPALAAKVDPDDVLQSVLRSFFEGHAEGQFSVRNWDALWAVLVVITVRKCRQLWRKYTTAGRNLSAEVRPTASGDDGEMPSWEATDREPLPEEAALLTELVEGLLRDLDPAHRPVLELRLQGYTVEEIAGRVGLAERTVHRVLAKVRDRLRQDLD